MPSERKHATLGNLFGDIANAIRTKDGTEAEIIADNFPERIRQIDTDPSGDATATAGDILSPKTAYVNGTKLTGSIQTKDDSGNVTLDTSTTSKSYAAGYYPNAHGAEIVGEGVNITPTESEQTVTPSSGKVINNVTVGAISSTYIGSDIPIKTQSDITVSGPEVTIPSGYYDDGTTKSVATTTHPNPTVETSYNSANNKLQITASHTQGTGYVTGSTTSATANIDGGEVTKSGAVVTTAAGYYDSDVVTTVDSATQATPSISATHDASNNKLVITATSTQEAGYVTGGTTSDTYDINDGTVSRSANVVTTGAGYYDEDVTTTVPAGSATTPTDSITSNPSISWNSTTKKIQADQSGSKSITPTVSEGYVTSGTAGTISTSGTASVTAESLDANLSAGNVKDGVTIFNTVGTFTDSGTITGSGKTAAGAGDILTGKSAFLNGAQLDGTMVNNGGLGGTITTQGGTYSIPAGYTSGGTVTAEIPAVTLTNSIIDGAAFEEADGDFGWQSTVTIPAGMHENQTLTKTFSDVFPAPQSEATADELLIGEQLYDHSGHLVTGTMANNGAVTQTINTQGGSYTIPEGYHDGTGTVTASLGTTSRSAGAGSVTLTKGAGSVSATGTNMTITESATQPSSGYYITAQGSGTVSGTGKGTVSTGTGYITSGSTTSNASASASETSNVATKYYTVAGSSVTSGQNLPSGGSAAGTAGYGKYAKVSAGYYPNDRYIGSGVSAGSATTPATSVSATVDSVSYAYDSTNSRFNVTGSKTGSAVSVTPTVSAGYVSSGTAGNVTPSASVAATTPKIAGSISISGTKLYTPSISRTAKPSADTWTDAANGAATTTKPTSGPYVQVNTAKNAGNVSASATISTAGYGTSSYHGISGSGNVEVGASASSNTYVPIKTSTVSKSGATVSYTAGWVDAGSQTVTSGSATTPATSIDPGAGTGSVNSSTGVVTIAAASATKSVTPTVSAGYVSSGTAGTITVNSKNYTYQLPTTKAATTYNVSSSDQSIAAGTYLTGAQTIRKVTYSAPTASQIASGVTLKIGDAGDDDRILSVTGTMVEGGTYTTFNILGSESWTTDSTSGGVYHDFTLSGVTANSSPVLNPVIGSASSANGINAAWATVFKATTAADKIRLYATAAITTAMTVGVKGY